MVMKDGVFPEVDWIESWPKGRSKSAVIVPVAFTIIFSALAVTPILGAPWGAGPVVTLGAIGGVLAFLGLAYFFASLGFGYFPRRNAGITPYNDATYGSGIRLDVDRLESTRLLPALAGMSVYGFCGWLDWRAGGDALLPMSKSNTGGATVALIFSVVTGVSVLLFGALSRWSIQVGVHPLGIVRRLSMPFGKGKNEFVPWEDVVTIDSGAFSSGKAKNLPILKLHLSDSSAPPSHRMFDQPGVFGIPLHIYRCDPNSLFSIVVFLHQHPEKRGILTFPEIPQWFIQVEQRGEGTGGPSESHGGDV
ncbi:hypothetical protein ACFWPH_09265 [Nocardia sp. NPDC058499]|uniref:hypothetical protein n=1 Tax=Nocardia sp. NPDC058499 TaxID=3346530 RepID=UPI00365DBE33